MPTEVREMKRDDKTAVMEILRNTSEFKPVEVDVAEELIDAYLSEGPVSGYHTYVGTVNLEILGYICYGPTPITTGTWDVYWMAVAPGAQRQGVGRALLKVAEEKIKAQQGRLILIETSGKQNYIKAQNFYSLMGYELISRITDFYEPGDDKLTYLKRLV